MKLAKGEQAVKLAKKESWDPDPGRLDGLLNDLSAAQKSQNNPGAFDGLVKKYSPAEIENLRESLRDAMIERSRSLDASYLWEKPERARSYWILLLNGVDDEDERAIGRALFTWKHLAIKDSARIVCIQTSERNAFRFACRLFDVGECPTLILGDSTSMESYLKFDQRLLIELLGSGGAFQRFANRLHTMIENGNTLEEVGKNLNGEKFWNQMKLVYGEVKSLFSINVTAKADMG